MKIRKYWINWLLLITGIILISGIVAMAQESPGTLAVAPEQIDISTFYHGSNVRVSADVPQCDGAVLVLEGEEEEVTLNRKGRVAGIWLNVAKITISDLPNAYIMATSEKLDDICSPQEQEKLGLGENALRSTMHIASNKPLTGKEFAEYMRLKRHNGTYNLKEKIEMQPASGDTEKLKSVLRIPSVMPPGIYKIHLFCFRNGMVSDTLSSQIKIEKVGIPSLMTSLAHKLAALYGLLAIVVAMGVGILMDIIFNSVPGSGH